MNPILISPHIDEQSMQGQINQIKSYLYQFKEQVEMILSNIDSENLSQNTLGILDKVSEIERSSKIKSGNYSSEIKQLANEITLEVTRATTAEGNLSASISITDQNVSTKVSKNGVISAINQSAEKIQISAGKVDLDGYVTFTSLNNPQSQTFIDGANIKTGTISADQVSVNKLVFPDGNSAIEANSAGGLNIGGEYASTINIKATYGIDMYAYRSINLSSAVGVKIDNTTCEWKELSFVDADGRGISGWFLGNGITVS